MFEKRLENLVKEYLKDNIYDYLKDNLSISINSEPHNNGAMIMVDICLEDELIARASTHILLS